MVGVRLALGATPDRLERDQMRTILPIVALGVRGIVGCVAPVTQRDIDAFASARLVEGDIWIYTNDPLGTDDESTQETAWMVFHRGYYYTVEIFNDWHYAEGIHYVGRRRREESGD